MQAAAEQNKQPQFDYRDIQAAQIETNQSTLKY